jgi:hypothetical protein
VKQPIAKLKLERMAHGSDDTLGALYWDNSHGLRFLCFTLEDEHREEKVAGETRIPEGCYRIKLRTWGGFHQRYLERYGPRVHRGMLWLQDVPNFEHILIHSGNTEEHTAGCILLGDELKSNKGAERGFLGNSRRAYERVYMEVVDRIEEGQEVILEIVSK